MPVNSEDVTLKFRRRASGNYRHQMGEGVSLVAISLLCRLLFPPSLSRYLLTAPSSS
jgi:hypothetical protein